MEPDGQSVTPGTNHGLPSISSAQDLFTPTFLNCSIGSLCSPNSGDNPVSAKWMWDVPGEEGLDQSEGSQPTTELPRGTQRKFKFSTFPTSLSWDSDSEKETLDEEELQNFSNPHGLAVHSPGSPSFGFRLDSEDDQECGKLHHFHCKTETNIAEGGHGGSNESTMAEEPNTSQLGQQELAESRMCTVSESAEPFLFNIKLKDGCQRKDEARNSKGEKRPKDKESKEYEKDVYTFPGDSDPESPPPAPWAHCTFIQRCRKKRVLLRPFSGLSTLKRTSPEAGKPAAPSPQNSNSNEAAQQNPGGGVYDFKDDSTEEMIKFRGNAEKRDAEEEDGEMESAAEIFTCVECSIYFKKQAHLQEHMAEHCQVGAGGRRRLKGSKLLCNECGWRLPNHLALDDHQRKHQQSRLKILEEIEKLNDNETPKDIQSLDGREQIHSDPTVSQHSFQDTSETSGPKTTASLASVSAVADLDSAPQNPGQTLAQTRNISSCHRRFVCAECNFSTKTSQALANHSKTHNRKNLSHGSLLNFTSTSPEKSHCAFLTTDQTTLRKLQTLVLPERVSTVRATETRLSSKSNLRAQISKKKFIFESGCQNEANQTITASEDGTPDDAATQPGFKCDARLGTEEKTCSNVTDPEVGEQGRPGNRGEEQEENHRSQANLSQQEANTCEGGNSITRTQPITGNTSQWQNATSPSLAKHDGIEEDKGDAKKDLKVFCSRRSSRISAASVQTDSDDDEDDTTDEDEDVDEEHTACFLPDDFLDEDIDEIDDDSEVLKSIERKCPYCPDRFHNGIGLANHVRGHLNRVGVSYNVRHFISPEEVNEIEKKFFYQKKKKKVANFDPDTFSVMYCEFCRAGFDTRAGLSSHARAHLRDFGITNWDVTISPIHIMRELFSRRPDLVIPMGPPRSHCSSVDEEGDLSGDDDEKDSKDRGIIQVKLEGETSKRSVNVSDSGVLPAASHQLFKKSEDGEDGKGDDEEAAEEEDEEEVHLSAQDGLSSSFEETDGLPPQEDANTKVQSLKCEVCNSQFGSKRGLSIHARAHLRQLGITVSENSGPSVEILYKIAKERSIDGKISPSFLKQVKKKNPSQSVPVKNEGLEEMDLNEEPIHHSSLAKPATAALPPSSSSTPTPSPGASPAPSHSGSPSSVVKKVPISSLLPVSSPLRSPEHKVGGIKSMASNLSAVSTISTAKPLWAPQENDAPLNLTLEADADKDNVCQLCGAWFETRKGLSSHARAHLRHFGVEYSESKGSPINLLNQFMGTDDFKHKASSLELDSPTEPQDVTATLPSSKQSLLTISSSSSSSHPYKVTTAGSGSILKATSSSASSLPGQPVKRLKASSMKVFRLSSGELMALPNTMSHEVEPTRDIRCEFCGEYFENRKGLSSHARSHLRQMGITQWSVNGSPIDTLREIMKKKGTGGSSQSNQVVKKEFSHGDISPFWEKVGGASNSKSLGVSGYQFSKFRKSPLSLVQSGSKYRKQSVGGVGASSPQSTGKFFRVSPLGKRPLSECTQSEESASSSTHRLKTLSSLPHDFSIKRKPSPDKHAHQDPSCELCGFYFENRKALASHARAHLRQFGVTEWSVNGSPIETLSAWMRSRPQKVLEMHRNYMQGSRSTLKKKAHSSSSSQWSSSLASLVRPQSHDISRGPSDIAEDKSAANRPGRSSPSFSRLSGILPLQAQVARSELNVRLPRGFERRPLKHPSCPDGTETESGIPKSPRTGTIAALVPKPPSYPLVKLVGKFYTLKCRFCEVEFHGPLSVQEEWIRHLQQHILKMNYKTAATRADTTESHAQVDNLVQAQPPASASTPTSRTTPTHSTAPSSHSPTPLAKCAATIAAPEIVQASEEQTTILPPPIPPPSQIA
ncbi:protein Wiz isoform X3 [Nothobranchius furzeri]|uniref:protein Wiz isoform X3 n=1 Tax=Nothobranchius furzeri TaxID=105023 RepID=UPI003904D733